MGTILSVQFSPQKAKLGARLCPNVGRPALTYVGPNDSYSPGQTEHSPVPVSTGVWGPVRVLGCPSGAPTSGWGPRCPSQVSWAWRFGTGGGCPGPDRASGPTDVRVLVKWGYIYVGLDPILHKREGRNPILKLQKQEPLASCFCKKRKEPRGLEMIDCCLLKRI